MALSQSLCGLYARRGRDAGETRMVLQRSESSAPPHLLHRRHKTQAALFTEQFYLPTSPGRLLTPCEQD